MSSIVLCGALGDVSASQTLDNIRAALYNFNMSNMTDGKKALAAGDFELARKKLTKALDGRPNDGELWWALMLCKYRWKNDGEMETELEAQFIRAARSGAPAPSTPFDSVYCKNALAYSASTKRRDTVARINAKLSGIWEEERGKKLKLTEHKVKASRSGTLNIAAIVTYLILIVEVIGAGVAVCGVYVYVKWAQILGLTVFAACAVAWAVAGRMSANKGAKVKGAYALGAVVLLVGGIALASVGFATANRAALISAAIAVCAAALAVTVRFTLPKGNSANNGGRSGGNKHSENTRQRRVHVKRSDVGRIDDYEDTFD